MNLTLESSIILVANIPVIFALFLLLNFIRKNQNRIPIFYALTWTTLFFVNILAALGYSTLNKEYLLIRIVLFIPLGCFLIIGLDLADREKIDYRKLIIMAILGTMIIFNSAEEGAFMPGTMLNGESTINHTGNLRITLFLISLYEGLLYLVFAFRLFRSSPNKLKRYAALNFFGAFSLGVLSSVSILSGLTLYVPGLAEIFIGIGALCNAIAFSKEPQLAYILPFKVSRLMVINTTSGISLFNHVWILKEKNVDSNLFTGFFQGISLLAKETLDRGNIREIYFEKGILIIQPNLKQTMASILVVSNPSLSLRKAITNFTTTFCEKFQGNIAENVDLTDNLDAKALITQFFPHVPEY